MLTWAIFFFFVFFLCLQILGYRKKKEKEESSHRPATRILVQQYKHTVFICIDLKLLFLVAYLLED